ncbi:MAG: hypothetical protein AAB839_03030 [Patescibacteria group bacterium]
MVKETRGAQPLSRSLKVYQRIAVAFVFMTFFLLLAVLYLSISRATITVVANPRVVSVDTEVRAVTNPTNDGELSGIVLQKSYTTEEVVTLPSDGATAVEEKAGGKVTLINETGTSQPLVATTRLLTKEGVLFRIDASTVVPAKGQVEVVTHADKPGLGGEIGPAQFTIPGLPESLQASIYAVSVESMKGGVAYKRVVTQKDIDDGVSSVSNALFEEAKADLSQSVDRNVFTGESYTMNIASQGASVATGAEVGSFTATVTIDVTAVYYDANAVKQYALSQLYARVPDGYAAENISTDAVQITVKSADVKNSVATLGVYLEGKALISADSQVLNKDRFVGRAPNEVLTLLRASEAVKDASVSFTPFWLERVPTLKDHIKIIITSAE